MFAVAWSFGSDSLRFLFRININASSLFDFAPLDIRCHGPPVGSSNVLHWLRTRQRSHDGPCWDRLHYCWIGKSCADQNLSRYVAFTSVFVRCIRKNSDRLTSSFRQEFQNRLYSDFEKFTAREQRNARKLRIGRFLMVRSLAATP